MPRNMDMSKFGERNLYMGKFDGYLICSDLDGTFRGEDNAVSVNSKAVTLLLKNHHVIAAFAGNYG